MPTYNEIVTSRSQWCHALKYDDLPQTTGHLANEDYSAFCCLGVGPEKVDALKMCHHPDGDGNYTWNDMVDADGNLIFSYDEDEDAEYPLFEGDLPADALKILGLTSQMQSFLIGLNDDAKLSFYAIAEVIERLPILGADDSDIPTDAWDEMMFIHHNMALFRDATAEWYQSQLSRALYNYRAVKEAAEVRPTAGA